jgi:hypothetical protein
MTCGDCSHWTRFVTSDWGSCISPDVQDSVECEIDAPTYPSAATFQCLSTFGCIYWKDWRDK